ncbi:MAG: DUF2779 domain-containing protein [Nanoarchaeota archaeon]
MLTKSNYLLGLQCPKLLWVSKNNKERIPEYDEMTLATFKNGEIIGDFAKKLFPEGIDLSKEGFKENLEKTKELLEKRVPLFEAGFSIDNLYSRADVLLPVEKNKWDILEVKSATKVKEVNIHDVSFQKYVYEKAGLKIRNCFVIHIDNQYAKEGEIEPEKFFTQNDITEKVEEFGLDIEKRIENMLKIINSKEEPKCSIGVHCSDPFDCSITGECWSHIKEGSVFEFYRMRKKKIFELYDSGIKHLNEVPDSVKLNDKQKIQRLIAEKKETHKDKKQIKHFLDNLKYPLYYLDFETINPAIPKFEGMKPYQRIPFQFSLHIQEKPNGELKHIGFLAEGINDPRQKFLQSLKDNLGKEGDILVYNQAFEKGVLRECCRSFPEFQEWCEKNIMSRVKDLWDVFKGFWYYDSKQKGSASIKAILPLFSDLSHKDLDITKGDIASYEYARVTYGSDDEILKDDDLKGLSEENIKKWVEDERKKVRDALEKYCELDTLAEVEIVKGLGENIKMEEIRR